MERPLMVPDQPIAEGWMRKRGGRNPAWKRRYFVLYCDFDGGGNTLFYYINQQVSCCQYHSYFIFLILLKKILLDGLKNERVWATNSTRICSYEIYPIHGNYKSRRWVLLLLFIIIYLYLNFLFFTLLFELLFLINLYFFKHARSNRYISVVTDDRSWSFSPDDDEQLQFWFDALFAALKPYEPTVVT